MFIANSPQFPPVPPNYSQLPPIFPNFPLFLQADIFQGSLPPVYVLGRNFRRTPSLVSLVDLINHGTIRFGSFPSNMIKPSKAINPSQWIGVETFDGHKAAGLLSSLSRGRGSDSGRAL